MNFLKFTSNHDTLMTPIKNKNNGNPIRFVISATMPNIIKNAPIEKTVAIAPIPADCVIIKFVHFWPEFNTNVNFITKIFQNNGIKYCNSDEYVTNSKALKIAFIGSFVSNVNDMQKLQNIPSDYVKILYLSEPIEKFYEPCYKLYRNNYFDFVFGSINDNMDLNHYKFPYYLLYHYYESGNKNKDELCYDNTLPTIYNEINNYVKQNYETILSKKTFCLINSHDYYDVRKIIHDEINCKFGGTKFGRIVCPGKAFNNCNNHELNAIGKIEYLKQFIFNICPENFNTSIGGYITEKLFEACKAGCIPIYCGQFDEIDAKIFNKERIVFYDAQNKNSITHCIDKIDSLLSDPAKLHAMYTLPVFLDTAHATITELEKRFCNIFNFAHVKNKNNLGSFKLSMINCLNKQIVAPIENCTVSDVEKQFIELASNNKGNDVVFCSHMGLGDVLLNVGIINLLLNFYETVHYFCKREYVNNISTMFANKPSVHLIPVDKFENQNILYNMARFNFNTTDCVLAGIMKNLHPSLKSVIRNAHFNEYKQQFGTNENEKTLYQHIGLIHSDAGVKWGVCLKYYDVHVPEESMVYYQKIQQYTIMFMHELASTASTVDFSKIVNEYMNLPNYVIICANRNVYSDEHPLHDVAQPFVNLPIMMYYDTLRNATDIHVIDSCFSCIPLILRYMNAISPKTFMIYARDKPYDANIVDGQVIL